VQVALEGGLAVAAVSGYGAGHAASAAADPVDGRRELRPVGSGAVLDGVVQNDAIVVVGDLGFVPELDRAVNAALADRPGVSIVQADQPRRAVRRLPSKPGPGPGPRQWRCARS